MQVALLWALWVFSPQGVYVSSYYLTQTECLRVQAKVDPKKNNTKCIDAKYIPGHTTRVTQVINPLLRRAVIAAHGYRCVYCGDRADTADHILPTFRGGQENAKNLIAACQSCNVIKGSKRLELYDESEMRIKALGAAPLVEWLLAVAIAAETASKLRKKSPLDLTKLRIDK